MVTHAPAIVTLTLNPALDVTTSASVVAPVHKLRCTAACTDPGGGGVNVARVLQRMGADHLAIYLAGGVIGREHELLLRQQGVPVCVVPINGETRESFSVHETQTANDYRFVLPGPEVSAQELEALEQALQTHWPAQYLVVSGGIAPGVSPKFYGQLARLCQQRQTPMVLDSNGDALREGLAQGVFLVKPSWRELQELTGQTLISQQDGLRAARTLIQSGQAQVVAVSMGAEGAMLVQADSAWHAPALQVIPQTTIGAGDSFLALMVWSLSVGKSISEAFAYGMAGGAAALLHAGTGLCDPQDVRQWVTQVRMTSLQ